MSSGPFLCKCINEKSSLISSVWETVFCKYVKLLLRKHRFSYWSFMYINNYGGMFNCLRMPQGTQAASINFMGWSFHMEETSGQPCCRWPACTPAAACISGDRQMNRKPDRWTSLLRIAPTWWGLNHCCFVSNMLWNWNQQFRYFLDRMALWRVLLLQTSLITEVVTCPLPENLADKLPSFQQTAPHQTDLLTQQNFPAPPGCSPCTGVPHHPHHCNTGNSLADVNI